MDIYSKKKMKRKRGSKDLAPDTVNGDALLWGLGWWLLTSRSRGHERTAVRLGTHARQIKDKSTVIEFFVWLFKWRGDG